jgi:hypothetical protein
MTSLPKASAGTDIEAFLAAAKSVGPASEPGERGRLILALDATMSRQPTWDRALAIQSEMFVAAAKAKGLEVQLVYFRGFNECQASRWTADAKALAALMTTVDCRGGNTQIGRVLKHAAKETARKKVHAVVYVGDAVEEDIDSLCQAAGEIGLLATPLFMFLEGNDSGAARAFKEMARLSGGAFHQLDSSSPAVLGQLLAAVAAYASGGRVALTRLESAGNAASRLLLSQMKT